MAEKSQNADSGKEIKEKKKRQHNNRKVFRLCRQTLKRKDNTTTERSSDFVGRP